MRTRLLSIVLLLLATELKAQTPSMAGTYAVWFCSAVCEVTDTADAPLKGYIVLSEDTLRTLDLPDRARQELAGRSSWLLFVTPVAGSLPPNACFAFQGQARAAQLFERTTPGAFTRWGVGADSISVRLSASPDAFHTLRAVVEADVLRGVVRYHGFIGHAFDQELGSVHGVLLSAPDIRRCAD